MTVDHPDVVKAVAAAVERAQGSPPELTLEMYMTALKSGVEQAQQRRRELEPEGPRSVMAHGLMLVVSDGLWTHVSGQLHTCTC